MRPLPYALALGALGVTLAAWPERDVAPRRVTPQRASEPSLADWAGVYLAERGCGPEHGLVLAPDGAFRDVGACARGGDHVGTVTRAGELLHLRVLDAPTDEPGGHPVAQDDGVCACASREDRWLVPVRWDARRYLVPAARLDRFCDDANAGVEPREVAHGWAWMRAGGERSPAVGRPEVPAAWSAALLERPVYGRVLALDGPRHALVDKGRLDGVAHGRRLWVRDALVAAGGGEAGEDLCRHVLAEVVTVEEGWSRVWLAEDDVTLAPGLEVSSRRPRGLARGQREDACVRVDSLPPVPGTSRGQLEAWTEWVRAAYLRAVPAGELGALLAQLDGLDPVESTPAYLNAIGEVDLADARARERVERLYAGWLERQADRALWPEPPRVAAADRGEGEHPRPRLLGGLTLPALRERAASLVLWAEAWRALACRPERLAEYRSMGDR